jgi:hypothetical protein
MAKVQVGLQFSVEIIIKRRVGENALLRLQFRFKGFSSILNSLTANAGDQGGGNSKKLKKITRKVKGKSPKEICWREMTKHQIGKKNGEKSKKTRKRANFSSKPDISVKKPFFSGGKLKTYQCLRVFRLTRHLEQFVAVP